MKIECPECKQRFVVLDDLMGKAVECGVCGHKFKVTDDQVIYEKVKRYPGENKEAALDRFVAASANFKSAEYNKNKVDFYEEMPARRLIAAFAGIALVLTIIGLFLVFGGEEGAMRDVETSKRYILVGAAALVGGGLFIYGMFKERLLGAIVALIFGAALLSLPVFLPGNPTSQSSGVYDAQDFELFESEKVVDKSPEQTEKDYLRSIGYTVVEKAVKEHSKEKVFAVFLRGATPLTRDRIQENVYELTGEIDRGLIYERGGNGEHGFLLLVDQKLPFSEMVNICGRYGEIQLVSEELRVIDVKVNNESFNNTKNQDFLNPDSHNYERLNLQMMKGIDPNERYSAVKRLGGSEPKAYRHDIVKVLVSLLLVDDDNLKLAAIDTLSTWSNKEDKIEAEVMAAVAALYGKQKLNKGTVAFIIDRNFDGAPILLMELWESDPITWSSLMVEVGSDIEYLLVPKLEEFDKSKLVAALDILSQVGSRYSLKSLKALLAKENKLNAKSLKPTIDEIENRL